MKYVFNMFELLCFGFDMKIKNDYLFKNERLVIDRRKDFI